MDGWSHAWHTYIQHNFEAANAAYTFHFTPLTHSLTHRLMQHIHTRTLYMQTVKYYIQATTRHKREVKKNKNTKWRTFVFSYQNYSRQTIV